MSWKSAVLRGVAEVSLGRQRSPQHAEGPHMRPYLRAANVKDGRLVLDDVLSMNFSPNEQAVFALKSGDVLVTEGSGSLGSVGASGVWRGELDGVVCFQNTLLRLRPRPGTDPDFLAWWARAAHLSGLFASIASGANIYHISAERIRALRINLPPLEEQRRIASFLNAETSHINHLTRLEQLVGSRLREREKAYRDLLLNRLVSDVGEIPLRRFLRGIEQGVSPLCDNSPRRDLSEWAILKLSSIKRGIFDGSENKRLPTEISPHGRYEIRPGDLLVTRANTPELVGDIAVATNPLKRLLLPDLIYRLKLLPKVDPEFIAQVALSSRVRLIIGATARGASQSMVKLRGEDIKDWPVPMLSFSRQRDVAKDIGQHSASIAALCEHIDERRGVLEERRRALITAAVTGQMDVSTARGA